MKTFKQHIKSQPLNESKMSELHMHIKQGKSAEQIAKIMRIDVKTIKVLMKDMKESVDELDEGKQLELLKKYGNTIMKMWDKEGKSSDEIAAKLKLNSKDIKTLKGLMDESVELDEARKDVFVIVDKKGKVVASKLTKDNARKEISRHRGGTIVLDPDAKDGDVLKKFAKESVELDEAKKKSVYNVPNAMDVLKKFNLNGKVRDVPSINNSEWGTPGFTTET